MYSFMLSNWTTVRVQSTITTVKQGESTWLDLDGFQDVVAYLDVREFSPGGGTGLTLTYQTAPTKDDGLFAALTTGVAISATGVTITKMLKSTTAPLARWFRYQLSVTGPTGPWDMTFRIWVSANRGARCRVKEPLRCACGRPIASARCGCGRKQLVAR